MLAKSRIFFQLLLSQVSNQGEAPCLEEAWSWRYLKLNGEKKKKTTQRILQAFFRFLAKLIGNQHLPGIT